MKIYKTQSDVEKDIKDEILTIEGDVDFECHISIDASIIVTAGNINALDIKARDISAGNINALEINAVDIDALDINALDIKARNISYYAFCCVYNSIKCKSISGTREKHQEPICLEGKLEMIKEEEIEEMTIEEVCKQLGKTIKIKK